MPATRVIAFDFDGTLTTEDTFVAFMKFYHGTVRWYAKMLPLLPVFLRYKLGRITRHDVKDAVVRAVFWGEPYRKVQSEAKRFAETVIPGLIRPQGMARFDEHIAAWRAGGPEVVVCSASISPYLRFFFERYESLRILACELRVVDDLCTGELRGYNVWGENKVKRLREEFHSSGIHLVEAYGDSEGDVPMLEVADVAFWRPFRLS